MSITAQILVTGKENGRQLGHKSIVTISGSKKPVPLAVKLLEQVLIFKGNDEFFW